ncbi:hypothetical protein Rsub_07133 [Raphidocelis subcapitata]|uniref:Dephospho-kinase n=1 Tax=Raphidocelis subcapitata TaxID=307507 RepID=A0A2V0P2R6_9CHLO|nr:hypothetical protein Rsub_07133 [Raphidocelis subcapitata]|eukprot:GBF94146.1 hypothetical protein Rsub_07133 [Raphidocelis subcapitata]
MRVVGLTGGIASGKSTVSAQLRRRHGFRVVDADAIAHAVCAKGRWGYRRVVAAFGGGVLRPDGELDREALAALVFSDAAARRRLQAATHPAVALELLRQVAAAWLSFRLVVVIDMPLLFETGSHRFTRPRVLVAADAATQLARLAARDGCGDAAARARVAAQMPLEAKARLADVVLDNGGPPEALAPQVDALAARLRRGALLPGLLASPLGVVLAALAARAWGARLLGAVAGLLRGRA